MPGRDGYEVCRRLRAREATRELPIMFLSSLEDVKDKTRGFEAGGNDYLTKPFERPACARCSRPRPTPTR
jgi:DNA-binding response OmpR family regulator